MPTHTHDCNRCVFLGGDLEYDFYWCAGILGGSVIARYGSEGDNYLSNDVSTAKAQRQPDHWTEDLTTGERWPGTDPRTRNRPVQRALDLAIARGLVAA